MTQGGEESPNATRRGLRISGRMKALQPVGDEATKRRQEVRKHLADLQTIVSYLLTRDDWLPANIIESYRIVHQEAPECILGFIDDSDVAMDRAEANRLTAKEVQEQFDRNAQLWDEDKAKLLTQVAELQRENGKLSVKVVDLEIVNSMPVTTPPQIVRDPADIEEIRALHEDLAAISAERDTLKRLVADSDVEQRRLRAEADGLRESSQQLRSTTTSLLRPEQANKLRKELQDAKLAAERATAAYDSTKGELTGAQSSLAQAAQEVQRAKTATQVLTRERDRAREDIERLTTERDIALKAADEARTKADNAVAAEEAAKRRERGIRAANRAPGEVGLPLWVFLDPTSYNKGKGKKPDELVAMFPSPHRGRFVLELAQVAVQHFRRSGSPEQLRQALAVIKSAELDPHPQFDAKQPLAEALDKGLKDAEQWFALVHEQFGIMHEQSSDLSAANKALLTWKRGYEQLLAALTNRVKPQLRRIIDLPKFWEKEES